MIWPVADDVVFSELEDEESSAGEHEANTSEVSSCPRARIVNAHNGMYEQGPSKEEAKADSEAALQQAREALKVEWEQAAELKKVSEGKLGFEAW